ncbi:MAG: alpha/beta hydrolase [Sandaracinaceae bacterium]
MENPLPPDLRSEPDPDVTTATRVPTAPDFRAADRQIGWLVVNRWTYRLLRLLMRFATRPADLRGVRVSEDPTAGRGMRIVRPETVSGEGALLLIHGGGYVVGSSRDILDKAAMLARECGVPVFMPSYRLGPEQPFPAGLDDCHAAWRWLLDRAPSLGVDPSKIVIGGYSAGGGLAAALAQRLHDEGGRQPSAQLLIYPMLDDRTATRRQLDAPRHRVWSNRNNLFGWTGYLGHPPGEPSPPYAVPARREDLSGLPPAWVGVGTSDLFLDEDRTYARRLDEAGVDVTYAEVDGGIHGFDMVEDSPLTRAFNASAVAFTRRFV